MRILDLTDEEALDAAQIWWLFVVVGLVSLILGVVLVSKPSNSLATLAVIVGVWLVAAGAVRLIRPLTVNRGKTRGTGAGDAAHHPSDGQT